MVDGIQTTLSRAAGWIGADLRGTDAAFLGVCTDSRRLDGGELFIALRGPNHDGHRYVADVARTAAGAVVERPVEAGVSQLVVEDSRLALGHLARNWRQEMGVPLLAVTGSNGKTTVKEMATAILRRCGPVLSTVGNLNNDIGVPLTLLRLEPEHRHAVVEMGANHPGEIAYLTALAQPDAALITNAAAAHIAGFGSIEGVARAKGEIFEGLSDDGIAVINMDDPHAALWRGLAANRRVVTFGLDRDADVSADWRATGAGSRVRLKLPGGERPEVVLSVPGRHNVMNGLAAAAAATALGASPDTIVAGLESVVPVPGRLEKKVGRGGATVIDDTYNANPGSVRSALEVLAAYPGRRYLVLGEMAELGDDAEAAHAQAGTAARSAGIDGLLSMGELGEAAARAFGGGGMNFASHETLLEALRPLVAADAVFLIKGSRSARMERVVAELAAGEETT